MYVPLCLAVGTNIQRALRVYLVGHEAGHMIFGHGIRLSPGLMNWPVSGKKAGVVTTTLLKR